MNYNPVIFETFFLQNRNLARARKYILNSLPQCSVSFNNKVGFLSY